MKTLKKLTAFVIVLTLLVCQFAVLASADEFTVAFDAGYARVGTPLGAVVTGADSANVTYSWRVGNTAAGTGSSYTPKASDLEQFITVTATDSASGASSSARMFFSKLPVVYIDTEDGQGITSKVDYKKADMRMQGSDAYSGAMYNGVIDIRGRGNSTWNWPKKPYKIKLDKKTDLFGMGKNKHWVMLANYIDRSLMRNSIAVDLADQLGVQNMSTVFVDVVMNGSYAGNYQLSEQIRIDSTRVDIVDWEGVAEDDLGGTAEDLSQITIANGYDTTGGYLLELNSQYDEVSRFTTNNRVRMTFKSPEYANTNNEMMNYVRTYIQDYENACMGTDFYNAKNQHYTDLFEFDDLVNYWLACEFMNNVDSGRYSSTYMYKDIGGDKFHMGPVWDYDYSSGNPLHTQFNGYSCPPDHWQYGQEGLWYSRLVGDPYFVTRLQERYWETHDAYESTIPLLDRFTDLIQESGVADHTLWRYSERFPAESTRLRTWLQDRINWMDAQFATVRGGLTSLNVYRGDANITFDVQATQPNSITPDSSELIPADYVLTENGDVTVTARIPNSTVRNAAFYLNGLRYGDRVALSNGAASITVKQEDLVKGDSKNVIQVRGLNSSGSFVNTSFITLRNEAEGTAHMVVDESFTWPIADKYGIYYGATLDEIPFTKQGKAFYNDGEGNVTEVAGTFAWNNGSTVPPIGVNSYAMTFTPDDTSVYDPVSAYVSVTIVKPVTAALSILYNNNKDRTSSSYTPASWSVFSAAMNSAKNVLDNANATQKQIDAAKAALQQAVEGLVAVVGFSIDAPTSVIKNEKFTVDVTTDTAVTGLTVKNEKGNRITTKVVSKTQGADSTVWTLSMSIGTAGTGRTLTVCDQKGDELGKFTVNVVSASQITSITAPASAAAKEKFQITVAATSDITQIKTYNEKNAVIGRTILSKTVSGGEVRFVAELSIGTRGLRTVTVKGDTGYSGNYQYEKAFDIEII